MKQARYGCTTARPSRSNDNRRTPASKWTRHSEVPEHALQETLTGPRADSSAWVARIGQEEKQPPERERFSSPGSCSSKDSFSRHHSAPWAAPSLPFAGNYQINPSLLCPFQF